MARIRSIHPGLFTDEAWMSVSFGGRLMLIGIWTEADDQGIFEWKPRVLRMRIFPGDSQQTDGFLDELIGVNWLAKFDVAGKTYGAVRNFCKWQRPKSPQNVHPCPDHIAEFVRLDERDGLKPDVQRGTALGKMLAEQQQGRCFYCETEITFYRKKPNSLEIDHRIPLSRGGSDTISNLAASCRKCNSLKANMPEREFRSKFSPAELRDIHASHEAKVVSLNAKSNSPPAKTQNGEISPLMEEEGCREERAIQGKNSISQDRGSLRPAGGDRG